MISPYLGRSAQILPFIRLAGPLGPGQKIDSPRDILAQVEAHASLNYGCNAV
ncbi:MAG TPA: hypothetical protein VIB00_05500 [Pyrinomonadaceae bacterium]